MQSTNQTLVVSIFPLSIYSIEKLEDWNFELRIEMCTSSKSSHHCVTVSKFILPFRYQKSICRLRVRLSQMSAVSDGWGILHKVHLGHMLLIVLWVLLTTSVTHIHCYLLLGDQLFTIVTSQGVSFTCITWVERFPKRTHCIMRNTEPMCTCWQVPHPWWFPTWTQRIMRNTEPMCTFWKHLFHIPHHTQRNSFASHPIALAVNPPVNHKSWRWRSASACDGWHYTLLTARTSCWIWVRCFSKEYT